MKMVRYIFAILATIVLIGSVFSVGTAFSAEETENDMESRILVYDKGIDTESLLEEPDYNVLEEYDSFLLVETTEEGLNTLQDFDHAVEELNNKDYVGLQSNAFHTNEGEPELPESLTVDSESSYETEYYIVQLIGPTHPEWREELERKGAELHGFRQRFNFIVEMDTETKEDVEELDFVNWIGDYHPAYRFDEDLLEKEGDVLLDVQLFEGLNPDLLAREISQTGAEIISVVRNTITVEIDAEKIGELASLHGVNSITESVEDYELFNSDATWVTQTNEEDNRKVLDEGISGEGEIITVADSGLYPEHEAFDDEDEEIGPDHRKIEDHYIPEGGEGDLDAGWSHGTHVTGTVLGDSPTYGEYENEDGNALEARVNFQDVSEDGRGISPPDDLYDNFYGEPYDEKDSHVHTNSWGGGSGYGEDAQVADEFTWDHKDFNILYAAGNDGDGEETISAQGEGKNVFTVGALENHPNEEDMADFSSRGYAEDGRIKPTILHIGEGVMSASGDEDNPDPTGYESMSGTSMSCPGIAGQVGQVRQYYEDGFHTTGTENPGDGFNPSNALVRATLINGAVEVSGSGAYNNDNRFPNNDQGFGRSQLDRAMYFEGDDRNTEVFDSWDEGLELDTGESWDMELEVDDPNQELEVTLAWTDPPADQGADPTIVNDLDLEVEAPDGTRYVGNAFEGYDPGYSESDPTSNPWDGPRDNEYDGLNVEENVLLLPEENGVETGTYEVTVTAHDVPEESQPFAVVASGGITEDDDPGPQSPTDPEPEHGDEDISTETDLSAEVNHDEGEDMDVEFFDADDDSLIGSEEDVPSGERAETTWSDLDYGTEYEWYAEAEDDDGETAQSMEWSFTTIDEPGPISPTDPEPQDGAEEVDTDVDLSAFVEHDEGEDMDVTFYDALNDDEIGADSDVPSGERAEVDWDDLDHETEYEWYAVAEDDDGVSSESSIWSFTTKEETLGPLPPTDPDPEDEQEEVSTDVELSALIEHEAELERYMDQTEKSSVSGEPPINHRPPAQRERAGEILIRWDWDYEDYHTDKAVAISGETTVQVVAESDSDADDIEAALDDAGADMDNVSTVVVDTDSHWIRDYGPMPIVDKDDGEVSFLNMEYAGADGRPDDNEFPRNYGDEIGVDYHDVEEDGEWFTIDGGHKFVEGSGILYTTDDVYDINTNIGGEDDVEEMAREWFNLVDGDEGFETVSGDHGFAHLDMQVNILDETTVVVSEFDDPSVDPDAAELLDDTADFFENEATARSGESFEVERLPMHVESEWGVNTYYTHANSIIVNDIVLVPEFGHGTDADAIGIYEDTLPEHDIIGIDSADVADMGGAIHCTTREIPEENAPPSIEITQVDASPNQNVVVEAEIETDAAFDTAHVYYDTNGADDFEKVEMEHISGDSYEAELGSYGDGTELNYFIRAEDDYHAVTYEGDAWDPHTEVVEDLLMDVTFYDASDDSEIDTVEVEHGERAEVSWHGLEAGVTYDWYAEADDGTETAQSDVWSFTTQVDDEVIPPTNVEAISLDADDDVELTWDDNPAPEYNVYHSENQYDEFNEWELLDTVEETNYIHEGALGGENYYLITSTDGEEESEPSDMVFSVERGLNSYDDSIRHFVSIPAGFPDLAETGELTASDLVIDIEGDLETSEHISEVLRWDYLSRDYDDPFYYDEDVGEWEDDFEIEPGDGIALTVEDEFDWQITGRDIEYEVTYGDERPRHYTSIPYTLEDQTDDGELRASDLVTMIEGDLESREYISDVVRWDPANEDHDERFYYDDFTGEWVGDFEIEPGDGIGFSVESEFTLEFELIDPDVDSQSTGSEEVPDIDHRRKTINILYARYNGREMDTVDLFGRQNAHEIELRRASQMIENENL